MTWDDMNPLQLQIWERLLTESLVRWDRDTRMHASVQADLDAVRIARQQRRLRDDRRDDTRAA